MLTRQFLSPKKRLLSNRKGPNPIFMFLVVAVFVSGVLSPDFLFSQSCKNKNAANTSAKKCENHEAQNSTCKNPQKSESGTHKTKSITWTGPEGKEFEGVLTYPPDYNGQKHLPLVVDVHNGYRIDSSKVSSGLPYHYMSYQLADKGFAILRLADPKADNWHQSLQSGLMEDPASNASHKISSGIRHTIDMDIAHPDSIAVMEWDHHGYLETLTIIDTGRVKTTSGMKGLSKLYNRNGIEAPPNWKTAELGGEHQRLKDRKDQSTVFYRVENVDFPASFLHDHRDQPAQPTHKGETSPGKRRMEGRTKVVFYPTSQDFSNKDMEMNMLSDVGQWFGRKLADQNK